MTDNEYLALKVGDKVKFTGMRGGIPAPPTQVPAGTPAEVEVGPVYQQPINLFKVCLTVTYNSGKSVLHTFVLYSDEIDMDWSRQPIVLPGPTGTSIPALRQPNPTPMPPKCECGAAAIGIKLHTPGHSTWCPGRKQ